MWISASRSDGPTDAKGCTSASVNTGHKWKYHHASDATYDEALPHIIDNPPKLFDAVNKHGLAIFLIVSGAPFHP